MKEKLRVFLRHSRFGRWLREGDVAEPGFISVENAWLCLDFARWRNRDRLFVQRQLEDYYGDMVGLAVRRKAE